MTDASTATPKTNARPPRRQQLDMADQLKQLQAGPDAGTGATADAGAPAQQAREPREPREPRESRGPRPPRQNNQGGGNQRPQRQQQPRRQGEGQPQGQQRQAQGQGQGRDQAQAQPQRTPRKVSPALERLFELYPQLFGARFLPLKLGVYEELLARHPEDFKAEDLKIAMGQHARSTRYLEAVAAGLARHDLDGNALDPVAPEHVHHAILELHRRRLQRANGEDLRPQLVARIAKAVEASGLDREAYAVLVRSRDENNNAVVDEALAELAQQAAKREALLRAFEASGRSEQEFADMYGMKHGDVTRTLQRARKDREAPAPASTPAPEADATPAETQAVEATDATEAQAAPEQAPTAAAETPASPEAAATPEAATTPDTPAAN
ncbi:ProQ/FINO family protein [Variovorax sp. J22G73]|uniref:ProQ/FinO family protein n=1 Tax=unclassified Variovorax TaxID=663243 RepID=UPI002578942D|nr:MULTISPECIES: ProQ/FINO family protein [unclassified Variovorax]MDM0008742.1 ProQ/FINO family protein [Variovorax sp. J22R203]MDM0101422.1 ProQ/FINO family protein [Variovorax sp. J22G73]